MNYRWIGAVLIFAGCGGWGFTMASQYRRQEKLLKALSRALRAMRWELQYRLTDLPQLCREAGRQAGGPVGRILTEMGMQLEQQLAPDAASCMASVLPSEKLPLSLRRLLSQLGSCLGRYDLSGQLEGLETVLEECGQQLEGLSQDRDQRLRNYGTLGLCTGAALAILFI